MNISNSPLAEFSGRKIVIKLSGKAVDNDPALRGLMREACGLWNAGARVLIVHGGGKQIDEALKAAGIERKVVDGIRVTDEKTLEIVKTVLESIRKKIVNVIAEADAGIAVDEVTECAIFAKIKNPAYGLVGEPVGVDGARLNAALERGIGVLCSLGRENGGGAILNVNADHAATEIAKAIRADTLVFISDVPGVLADINDRSSVISRINRESAAELIKSGRIAKGMIPKITSCVDAAKSIGSVLITDDGVGVIGALKGNGGTTIVF